ncbi:hypothetical protein Cgig2_015296 [Carnegiea gigantea]|uniref:Aminotransferase-like plant mobile domain-containing protein n=1 Tax=Carnegiea gigantea TaxID=171969 RepID=A0A9Q1JI92_9CARY|nr:hypothetical protein Cgig2_015296 [Carnegiea gigantea]
MSIRSFSSMAAQLNEAQTEPVRSMGFASFLNVDLKQILGRFLKWLIDKFDPYFASFVLPDGQRFMVTAFDAYVTLGMPISGKEIMGCSRSLTDEEYDEVDAPWHTTPELACIPEFILAKKDGSESFKRNFMIYLANCFFSGPKNYYCSKTILKYIKDVDQIAYLDWCKFAMQNLITSVRHYKERKSAKGVRFDGLLFFLMLCRIEHHSIKWPEPSQECENYGRTPWPCKGQSQGKDCGSSRGASLSGE